jgi:hypothetical protein
VLALPSEADLRAPTRYMGIRALDPLPPPANPALPLLFHIHISSESLPISSNKNTADAGTDIYALAALQMLLGDGDSFSSGRPGKGMFFAPLLARTQPARVGQALRVQLPDVHGRRPPSASPPAARPRALPTCLSSCAASCLR